jgi:hypothetical protein
MGSRVGGTSTSVEQITELNKRNLFIFFEKRDLCLQSTLRRTLENGSTCRPVNFRPFDRFGVSFRRK